MFIPLRTDAPVYHRPIATIGFILACAALSIASWFDVVDAEPLMLQLDEFRPHQWITANLMHAGPMHLIGNAIFLWVFGLIVEGKVGWQRFLLIVAAIGIPQCALEQLLFSGGASLGASAIVFGLVGVAMIWAPKNEIEFAWYWLYRCGTFDVTVRATAICYGLWEAFWMGLGVLVNGFSVTSELLHLMGLVIGIPVGVVMLKKGLVNCEGWDWFSVRRGDHRRGVIGNGRRAEVIRKDAIAAAIAPPSSAERNRLIDTLRRAIADADVDAAERAATRLRQPLGRVELIGLADLLYGARRWPEAAERMSEARRRFADAPARLSLRRAEIAVRHETRPAAALELLTSVPSDSLTPAEAAQRVRLIAEAERAVAANPLEFADAPL